MKYAGEIKCILKNIPTIPVKDLVRMWIEIIYERFSHNKARTAKALGVSRTTLDRAQNEGSRMPRRSRGRPTND